MLLSSLSKPSFPGCFSCRHIFRNACVYDYIHDATFDPHMSKLEKHVSVHCNLVSILALVATQAQSKKDSCPYSVQNSIDNFNKFNCHILKFSSVE